MNSTRVYISLRCCLSGPAVRFRRRAGGFQRPAKWLKWCTSPLFFFFFCFLSSLFIWSLLFDSFIPHTIDSSVNRLCGLISTWPPIPDERILQFTSSRTVDQRFPILFFFLFSFVHCFCSPPPFSDRNPVFSSSVTHPHFYYVLPFPYSPLLLLKMPGKQIGVLSATSYTRLALRYFSLCDRNSQLYLLI